MDIQKGPRAHHFVSLLSILAGLSFIFETYTLNLAFVVLDGILPISGQTLWGILMLLFGVLVLLKLGIVFRGIVLGFATLVWSYFGLFILWASLLGPMSNGLGSFSGILSIAVASVCILASANLKRDYKKSSLTLK